MPIGGSQRLLRMFTEMSAYYLASQVHCCGQTGRAERARCRLSDRRRRPLFKLLSQMSRIIPSISGQRWAAHALALVLTARRAQVSARELASELRTCPTWPSSSRRSQQQVVVDSPVAAVALTPPPLSGQPSSCH